MFRGPGNGNPARVDFAGTRGPKTEFAALYRLLELLRQVKLLEILNSK